MRCALLDSSVLFPNVLRDALLTIAEGHLYRPHWSDAILDEVERNLVLKRGVAPERFQRMRDLMNRAFLGAEVIDWPSHMTGLELPDADDRHVLAAAIAAGAPVIVTANLRDFPAVVLGRFGISAVHPADFLTDLLREEPATVVRSLERLAARWSDPPSDLPGVLGRLDRAGVGGFADEARRYL